MSSAGIDLYGIAHVKVDFILLQKMYVILRVGRFVWTIYKFCTSEDIPGKRHCLKKGISKDFAFIFYPCLFTYRYFREPIIHVHRKRHSRFLATFAPCNTWNRVLSRTCPMTIRARFKNPHVHQKFRTIPQKHLLNGPFSRFQAVNLETR